MDKVIFGDNQFLGVNHMSEERGMENERKYQNPENIINVIKDAYDCGIRSFSFSSHDRATGVCNFLRNNIKSFPGLKIYAAIPYAQKYAQKVNEEGIFGAINDVIFKDNSFSESAGMIARGGLTAFKKDPVDVMKLLVDAELKMFKGLPIEAVFLQNNVTDLILGLGWDELLKEFVKYIENKYQARAGFITFNLPELFSVLDKAGIQDPLICSAINKLGFQMNPNNESYEKAFKGKKFTSIAMSFMAAGALRPEEGIKYLSELGNVDSVLFGSSNKSHIRQTKELIESYL